MFVTRALAATALAGMAFGLSAPIAFADDFTPSAYSYGDCGHRGGHEHGRGDDRGNDRGRGDDRGNGRGDDRGDRGDGGGRMGGGDDSANQYNDSEQAWAGDDGGRDGDRGGRGGDRGDRGGDRGNHGRSGYCAHHPSHGADTGLGGSITGMNTTQTALGGGLLATAVAGGGVYLKRRRPGFNV
jgi:hypothetical protein